MLNRLTSLLAGNLNVAEKEVLLRTLDPASVQAKSALQALTTEVDKLQIALRKVTDERKSLEAALQIINGKANKAEAERNELHQKVQALQNLQREEKKKVFHPIYGTLLHDFGYKKVYASEPRRLVDKLVLPVWERQRTFRVDRAKQIAKAKSADMRFGLPGVISIFDLDEPGKRGIVDGQHRIGGLEILLNDNKWSENSMVLTEVYRVADGLKEVGDLFLEINQAQPAYEIDLPGAGNENLKKVIDIVSAQLEEQFPSMFSTSTRPVAPNLNVDLLRQELFQSDKVKAIIAGASNHGNAEPEAVAKALSAWLLEKNEKLSKRTVDEWKGSTLLRVKNPDRVAKAVEKCSKGGLFIGLDLSWL